MKRRPAAPFLGVVFDVIDNKRTRVKKFDCLGDGARRLASAAGEPKQFIDQFRANPFPTARRNCLEGLWSPSSHKRGGTAVYTLSCEEQLKTSIVGNDSSTINITPMYHIAGLKVITPR